MTPRPNRLPQFVEHERGLVFVCRGGERRERASRPGAQRPLRRKPTPDLTSTSGDLRPMPLGHLTAERVDATRLKHERRLGLAPDGSRRTSPDRDDDGPGTWELGSTTTEPDEAEPELAEIGRTNCCAGGSSPLGRDSRVWLGRRPCGPMWGATRYTSAEERSHPGRGPRGPLRPRGPKSGSSADRRRPRAETTSPASALQRLKPREASARAEGTADRHQSVLISNAMKAQTEPSIGSNASDSAPSDFLRPQPLPGQTTS